MSVYETIITIVIIIDMSISCYFAKKQDFAFMYIWLITAIIFAARNF